MRYVTSAEMKKIDQTARDKFGIPALLLMENAGRAAAHEALSILKRRRSGRISILCGYGNNGGDGFVAARHLLNENMKVDLYLIGRAKPLSPEAKVNFDILKKMGLKVMRIYRSRQAQALSQKIKKCGLAIDAIFGIGLRGRLDIFYQVLFENLNSCGVPILAIDIPSGLDADTGSVLGSAIKAKYTVTMGLPKKGFRRKNAKKYLGKLTVADISLPKKIF